MLQITQALGHIIFLRLAASDEIGRTETVELGENVASRKS